MTHEKPPAVRESETASADNTGAFDPAAAPALAPPQRPDEIGRLGGYRVLRELGRGGMGVVYQAEDMKLQRLVALKVLPPALAADPIARQRFLREAQAMAAVRHDHVVTIYQVDEADGVPFLAMELLQGAPLDRWLKAGNKPTVAQVLRLGREMAEGLAAAHKRGLIHRDVKPGNVWLEAPRGRVKILDFGLARPDKGDVHLTRTGAVVGTPAYMAPEQARGEAVDARGDLFSLGCVLYKLSTGEAPFTGPSTMAVLTSLAVDRPKPVRERNDALPAELSDLVQRLLEKDPARRPASARAVADALLAIQKQQAHKEEAADRTETPTAAAAPAPRRAWWRRPAVVVTTAALLMLLVGLAAAGAAGLIRIQTPQGDYVIDTDDPDFFFQVHDGGVRLEDRKTNKAYALKVVHEDRGAGAFDLEVADAGDLAFRTRTFTIRRGDKAALTAWFEPITAPAVAAAPLNKDEVWVKQVAALPAEKQVEAVAAKLKELNPGFDSKVEPTIEDGVVTGLRFFSDPVTDISPVGALRGLKVLECAASAPGKGKLVDLAPLTGLKLTRLHIGGTQVADLSPLKGMELTFLHCWGTRVSDLTPLKGMPLMSLACGGTAVSDLSPLKGAPLTDLGCGDSKISDLSPLRGMPLNTLDCGGLPIIDLSPLKDMKLTYLMIWGTNVADLTPLKGMPLSKLRCDHTKISDLSPLKGMPLTDLNCSVNAISDLSPLKGMPLATLDCGGTAVGDLSPLKGMPLSLLHCNATSVTDLSPLTGMPLKAINCDFLPSRDAAILRSLPKLEQINGQPAADFWKDVDAAKP